MFINRRDQFRELKTSVVLAGVAAVLTVTAGCGGSSNNTSASPTFGLAKTISNGTAHAYVVTDNASNPTAIGVEVSRHVLDNPDNVTTYPDAAIYNLTLPTSTPQLPFRSATFFSTAGHGPDLGPFQPYEVPHYHISFSLFTIQQRSSIGANLVGKPASYPDASTYQFADPNFNTPDVYYPDSDHPVDTPYKKYVPISPVDGKPYLNYSDSTFTPFLPGSTTVHMGQELPTLGTVLYDRTVGEFNGGDFIHETDWQFFAGSLSAITITVPRPELVVDDPLLFPGAHIVKTPINPSIITNLPLGQPNAYQTTGYYPSTYSVRYNASSDTYDFELNGFKFHQGEDIAGNPQVKKG